MVVVVVVGVRSNAEPLSFSIFGVKNIHPIDVMGVV